MAARLASLILATAVSSAGCGFFMEPKPDLKDKKSTTIGKFAVEYPGNWTTTLENEDLEELTVSTLTIESKGNAIAVLQVFEPGIDLTPEDVHDAYVEGMLEAAKEEFGGVLNVAAHGAKDWTRPVLGNSWVGRTATIDVKLLGESVPNRIQSLSHYTEDRTVVIVVQAPAEDWKTASPGFDAIYDGLTETAD